MSMKILKGNVKYKDRSDIVCTYGTLDNGTSYYFMDSTDTKKFANGNRIATTLLVEAIDPMVKACNIGVIDPEGNVVIPFENKSIRPVDDNVIIVENSTPVSESVIEAINLRNDPLSATKLVSTPATIKEKLNQQMGVEGKYLFNDQFSEATLCDINGNNLINDERYSFIAQANDKLYMSKNVADSVINEYSLIPSEIQNNNVADGNEQAIDISASTMDQNVVENAIDNASSSVSNENAGEISMPPVVAEDENTVDAPAAVDAVTSEAVPVDEGVAVDAPAAVDAVTSEAAPVDEGVAVDVSAPVDAVASEAAPVDEGVAVDVPAPVDAVASEATPVDEGVAVDVPAPVDAVASEAAPVDEGVAVDVPAPVDAVASEAAPVDEDVAVDVPASVDEGVADDVSMPMDVVNDDSSEEITSDVSDDMDDNSNEVPVESNDVDIFASDSDVNNETTEEVTDSNEVAEEVQPEDNNLEENASVSDDTTGSQLEDMYGDQSFSDTNLDNVFANDNYDVFKSTSVQTDKIVDTDDYYTDYASGFDTPIGGYAQTDNIMTDVAKSMGELINQNRVQRNIISQCKGKIENYESQLRMAADRYNDQVKQNETLSNRLREVSSASSRLEAKNQTLEQKLHDLSRVLSAQEKELKVLRPQVEGKQDLVQLLADARAVLGTSDSYGYSEEPSYYRRVA